MPSLCYSTPNVPPARPEPPGSTPVSSCCCPSAWLRLLWWRGVLCAVCGARLKIRGGFCVCLLFKQLAWMFVCLLWLQVDPAASRCCSRAGSEGPVPLLLQRGRASESASPVSSDRPSDFLTLAVQGQMGQVIYTLHTHHVKHLWRWDHQEFLFLHNYVLHVRQFLP